MKVWVSLPSRPITEDSSCRPKKLSPSDMVSILIYSFGYGKHGQLGLSTLEAQEIVSVPTLIDTLTELLDDNVDEVSCGSTFTTAITKRGKIFEWGDSRSTQPELVSVLASLPNERFSKISSGSDSVFAITQGGATYMWKNTPPADKNDTAKLRLPTKISEKYLFKSFASGALHFVGVSAQSQVFVWGDNSRGQCGPNSAKETKNLELMKKLPQISKVACGSFHTVALSKTGTIWVWGDNRYGQCGLSPCNTVDPTLLDLNAHVTDVICGDYFTFALTSGKVYAFGKNKNGQLGLSFTSPTETPTLIPRNFFNGLNITKIAAGGGFDCAHVLALSESGVVFSWGSGSRGQLGHGNCTDLLTPTPIQAFKDKKVVQISCGALHSCVVVSAEPQVIIVRKPVEHGLGNLNVLPNEILNLLLSHVKVKELTHLIQCSKFFQTFACSNVLWRNLYHKDVQSVGYGFPPSFSGSWYQLYRGAMIETHDRTFSVNSAEYTTITKPQDTSVFGMISNWWNATSSTATLFGQSKSLADIIQNITGQLLFLGLDAAGKTTIIYQMKCFKPTSEIPTIGFNIEKAIYKKCNLVAWDIGGPDRIRSLWNHYLINTKALCYVIDSNDKDRLDESFHELTRMLSNLPKVPLLIFANKQDLPGAMTPFELAVRLRLRKSNLITINEQSSEERPSWWRIPLWDAAKFEVEVASRPWRIQPTIALTGAGLYEAFEWCQAVLNS